MVKRGISFKISIKGVIIMSGKRQSYSIQTNYIIGNKKHLLSINERLWCIVGHLDGTFKLDNLIKRIV